jgi:hypothetical protein
MSPDADPLLNNPAYGGRGMIIDLLAAKTPSLDALRAQARRERARQESERVITEGSLQRFLLCTASFGIAYPNPLKG